MKIALVVMVLCAAALLTVPGSQPAQPGVGCVRCHEMAGSVSQFRASSHSRIACETCHGGTLQFANMVKAAEHLSDSVPEQIRLKHADVQRMVDKCRECHQQQFADWKAGPHATTYAKIFTDAKHNAARPLMDDCLRCHGMHFEGGVRDLVNTVDRKGPWTLKQPEAANEPAIPCLACHSMHQAKNKSGIRSTLALFDRRDQQHVRAAALPVPAMLDGERPVKMSPDVRQTLCFQCHAAAATRQVGSGDDRTPKGVHEGISCLACHDKHGQGTVASCATCHPKMSNCGLDVAKMDTSFASKTSRHNIHWVRCEDCHDGKRPARRDVADAGGARRGS